MGYYFVRKGRCIGIRSGGGYSIINPEFWNSLIIDDFNSELDYSGIDESAKRQGINLPDSIKRQITIDLFNYPGCYIDIGLARRRYPEMLYYEKSRHKAVAKRLKESDLFFKVTKRNIKTNFQNFKTGDKALEYDETPVVVNDFLSVFLSSSSGLVHESVAGGLRIAKKKSAISSLFSSSSFGKSICIISFSEINSIEVSPQCLKFILVGGGVCEVFAGGEGVRRY